MDPGREGLAKVHLQPVHQRTLATEGGGGGGREGGREGGSKGGGGEVK